MTADTSVDQAISPPARVAVVGAGPAGIYTVEHLMRSGIAIEVDVFDRSQLPFGLVRYGVAPDHAQTRAVMGTLGRTLARPGVRHFGGVRYGEAPGDLQLRDLRLHYHAVVFATGAPDDRRLGIPGEDLPGSVPAIELARWYCGHPEWSTAPEIQGPSAVVVGGGNVALDIARMLLKGPEALAEVTLPQGVAAVLAAARVSTVHVLVRGVAADVKFGLAPLLELGRLSDVSIEVHGPADQLQPSEEDTPQARRSNALLAALAGISAGPTASTARPEKTLAFHFGTTPQRIHGSTRVTAVEVARTFGNGEPAQIPAATVIRAVGQRVAPLASLPFDQGAGIIPNVRGSVSRGVYVAGWLKRGPSGTIGTNRLDAAETAAVLLADLPGRMQSLAPHVDPIASLLAARGVKWTPFSAWVAAAPSRASWAAR